MFETEKLLCPQCARSPLKTLPECLVCDHCQMSYPVVNGIPHLLRSDNTVKTKLDEYSYDDFFSSEDEVPEVLLNNWQNIFTDHHNATGEVLELGCGSGYMTRALINNFSFSAVHAVDISPVFLEMAQKKVKPGS